MNYITAIQNETIEGDEEEFFRRIDQFEKYLESIDEPIVHQVPPLGMSIADNAPVIDKLGGTPPPVQGKRYTTTSNPEPINPEAGQPGQEV